MSKVLIAEGLGYNLLSVSQLMAKGIHLEADIITQEFKLFHGMGGLYIGNAVLKNNVFVLDFVPDQGTADSDAIVNFTSWTHPPDLDPDFSPGGFLYSHTIPEAERTRALATLRQEETTSTAATTATPTAPIADSSTAPILIDDTPPTPAQQLTPTPREVHRSANLTAGLYSNSDLYRRSPGHRASKSLGHERLGHPSNTTLNNTIKAAVLDKDSLLLPDGRELQRVRGTCFTCPEADLPHQPFVSHHNPSVPTYAPLEKCYSDILYTREQGQEAYNYVIIFIDAATRYVWHLNLPSRDMAFKAFVAWLPVAEREPRAKLKSFQSDEGGEYQSQMFKKYLAERGIKRLISLPYAHQQQGVAERMNRTLQNTMRKLLRGMRLPNHQRPEAMDHAVMLHNLLSSSSLPNNASPHLLWTGKLGKHKNVTSFSVHANRDLTGGFRGNRSFASAADEADWDEQNVDGASEEAGPLPYCSVNIPMDDDNPRESVNAETYFDFADTGYVTPQPVDANISERIGPNFLPDPEAGDEAAYPEDANLPRYTQSGLKILGLVTAVHGAAPPKEPATIQQALGGGTQGKMARSHGQRVKGAARTQHLESRAYRSGTQQDRSHGKMGFPRENKSRRNNRQIDVANAFLYAPVDAEIFVEHPHGSNADPNQVCQLQKSMYGIKQALRLWQQHLHARLIRIGFLQLPHDQGMYRLTKGTDYILLIVYVDDLLYIGSTDDITTWFEGELQRDLTLTVATTVTQYLGLNIQDGDNAIYLSAEKYTDTIAKRFGLTLTAITTPYRYTDGNRKVSTL
ncbi:unnamed protein product [Closterium sp. NIES-53]